MGVEYCLVKEDEKQYFDLGKGGWFGVFKREPHNLKEEYSCKYDLYVNILTHVAPSFSGDTPISYFDELAEKIINWAGDVEIQLWSDDYLDDKTGYTETGSRYIE